jgi:putative radical SAM enzyme (TIGR03279 family)
VVITRVGSAARRAGVRAGDTLVSVNGQPIADILDVRYFTYERNLTLELRAPDGVARLVVLKHSEGGDIGLSFLDDLPGGGKTCRNNCVFCFIDQNPAGCRESLYVKDDDARLSFLQGNYITLTNLQEKEVERICKLRISPLGVSVHATDPKLRVRLLRNKRAGECMTLMRRFADAGIFLNAQIVLVPSFNDGERLSETLRELQSLGDALISTSVVPVGLTKHRTGLPLIQPVSRGTAQETIKTVSCFPRVWCSDEMYLRAGHPIPPAEFYEDFPQLENGVGMIALFRDDWSAAVSGQRAEKVRPCTIATGKAAATMLADLLLPYPEVTVVAVENRFFGETVDVAGLLTGQDVLAGLRGRNLGDAVLIPSTMLRRGEDVFLDDMTVGQLSEKLEVPVTPVAPDAESLWREIRG